MVIHIFQYAFFTSKYVILFLLIPFVYSCDGMVENDYSEIVANQSSHPCYESYQYYHDWLGRDSDLVKYSTEIENIDGEEFFTEKHLYLDLNVVVYYRYKKNQYWCNSWKDDLT